MTLAAGTLEISMLSLVTLVTGCATDEPDFTFACAMAEERVGCGLVQCTIAPIDGFHGVVALRANAPAGVEVYGLGPPIVMADAPVELTIGVSAEPAADAPFQLQLTAATDDLTHPQTLDVALRAQAPPPEPGDMVLFGCAGANGVIADAPPLDVIYVGTWRNGFRSGFCAQTLSTVAGAYQLTVPASCGFTDGEAMYLTSGGIETCTLPFRAGTVEHIDVVVNATCP